MAKSTPKELMEDILHPVRMRILMTLAGSSGMSPLQIAEKLQDVPLATLYRHISRLLKAEVVMVVGERPARGTLEKIYALNQVRATRLGQDAFAQASKADHLRYFTSFALTLVDQFAHYVDRSETMDLAADGVGYHQIALFMSDTELVEFAGEINRILAPYMTHKSSDEGSQPDGRKKRIFSTILMPEGSDQ